MDKHVISKWICICYWVLAPVRMYVTQCTHSTVPCNLLSQLHCICRLFSMGFLMWWERTVQFLDLNFRDAKYPVYHLKSATVMAFWERPLYFFLFWFHLKLTRYFFLCFLTQPFIMFDRVKECFFPPLVSHTMENIMPLLWNLCCYPAYKVRPLFWFPV